MFAKTWFIFFMLVIVQIHCIPLTGSDGDDDDDGGGVIVVVNTAGMKLIEALVTFITETGIYGIGKLNGAMATVEEQLYEVEKTLVDLVWESALNAMNGMEKEASDIGKAMIECVKDQADDFKATVLDFATQSLTCQTQKVAMTLNTVVPILTDIKTTNEEMKVFTEQLDNCGNDETAIPCIDEIDQKMEDGLVALLSTVKKDIEDAQKFIDNIGKFVTLCQQDATDNLVEASKSIAGVAYQCMQDIFNSTSV